MPLDQKAIIKQIDDILSKCGPTKGESAVAYAMTVSAIRRLSPPGSVYAASLKGHEQALSNANQNYIFMGFEAAVGMLQALRAEYEAGYLQSIVELIHADTFADFLDMAHHLLEQGYKDPAAVVTGSVLESHLHKLCDKNSIPTTNPDGSPKKADKINAELTSGGTYNLLDQKSVTAWLDLRNKAAHGKYGEYTKEQVGLMLENVRNFITRIPA